MEARREDKETVALVYPYLHLLGIDLSISYRDTSLQRFSSNMGKSGIFSFNVFVGFRYNLELAKCINSQM